MPNDPEFFGVRGESASALCGEYLTRSISDSGRIIAFQSEAENLVPNDTNQAIDVFVKNMDTGSMELISVNQDGQPADGNSTCPSISADGTKVVFQSKAQNMRGGQLYSYHPSIYLRDIENGTTRLVSRNTDGSAAHGRAATISNDGRYIAFESWSNEITSPEKYPGPDVFIFDTETEMYSMASLGFDGDPAHGYQPFLSGDGHHLIFMSTSSNLVHGDTNQNEDVFWRNLRNGNTLRVNTTIGGHAPVGRSRFVSVSDDGLKVAFDSDANGLVNEDHDSSPDVFVKDIMSGSIRMLSVDSEGRNFSDPSERPLIDSSGRAVVFRIDQRLPNQEGRSGNLLYATNVENGSAKLFESGYDYLGRDGGPASWRGKERLVFASSMVEPFETNYVADVYLKEFDIGINKLVSKTEVPVPVNFATGSNLQPSISADGRVVMFSSWALNLSERPRVGGGIFLRDITNKKNELISLTPLGLNAGTGHARISGDGQSVVFTSRDSRLWPENPESRSNIYRYDHHHQQIQRILETTDNLGVGVGGIISLRVSNDGRVVLFRTRSNNIVREPTPGWNTFVIDLNKQTTRLVSGATNRDLIVELSSNGRYVLFIGAINNVGPRGIIVEDLETHHQAVIVPTHPTFDVGHRFEMPRVFDEGRQVAFLVVGLVQDQLPQTLLPSVFVYDRTTQETQNLELPFPAYDPNLEQSARIWAFQVSQNGQYVAYIVSDRNQRYIYRFDRITGQSVLAGTDRRRCPCESEFKLDLQVSNNGDVVFTAFDNMGIPGESRHQDAYLLKGSP